MLGNMKTSLNQIALTLFGGSVLLYTILTGAPANTQPSAKDMLKNYVFGKANKPSMVDMKQDTDINYVNEAIAYLEQAKGITLTINGPDRTPYAEGHNVLDLDNVQDLGMMVPTALMSYEDKNTGQTDTIYFMFHNSNEQNQTDDQDGILFSVRCDNVAIRNFYKNISESNEKNGIPECVMFDMSNGMTGNEIVAAYDTQASAWGVDTSTGGTPGTGSSTSAGGGGCFIATAAYGTAMAEEVKYLCRFRDECLLPNPIGKDLVDFYYKHSPEIADIIRQDEDLKQAVRSGLKPVIQILKVSEEIYRLGEAAVLEHVKQYRESQSISSNHE